MHLLGDEAADGVDDLPPDVRIGPAGRSRGVGPWRRTVHCRSVLTSISHKEKNVSDDRRPRCTTGSSRPLIGSATATRSGPATSAGRSRDLDRSQQRLRAPPRRPGRRRRRPGGGDDGQPRRVRRRGPRASASSARRRCCSARRGRRVEVEPRRRADRARARGRRRRRQRPLLGERLGADRVTDLDDADDRRRPVAATATRPDRRVDVADADEAVLVFSSGTTGLPEGRAPHPPLDRPRHRALVSRRSGLGPDDRFQVATPPSHILGLLNLLAAAAAGATVRLHRRFDLDEVLRRIESERMTLEMAVAPIALAMANHPTLEDYDLSSLRYIMWGATPVTESVAERRHRAHGRPVAAGLRRQRAAGDRRQPGRTDPTRGGSTRPACPPEGVELRVVGPRVPARCSPPGEIGEIQVRSPSVMAGYLPDEATADAFADGWYRTGDVGWLEPEGWVHLTDRVQGDDQGQRLPGGAGRDRGGAARSPGGARLRGVRPGRRAGRRGAGRRRCSSIRPARRRRRAASDSSPTRSPRTSSCGHVVVVDAIPRLPSGKVLRRTLRDGAGRRR